MKKIIFALILVCFATLANAQKSKIHSIFEKYQEAEGITSVKVGKPMFNMLNKLNILDEDLDQIKPLLGNINSINILITENFDDSITKETAGIKLRSETLAKEINSAISSLKYEELVTVNTKGNKVKLLSSSTDGDMIQDLVVAVTALKQNILVLLDGKVSMTAISNLINESEKGDK